MTAPPELERLALAQHPEKAGLVQGFTGGRLLVHCHSAHLIYVRVQGFAVSKRYAQWQPVECRFMQLMSTCL